MTASAAIVPAAASPSRPARPIGRKLALLVVAAVGTAVVVLSGVALWQVAERFAETKRGSLLATAEILAASVAPAVAAGDEAAAVVALRAIGRIPGLRYAEATGPDGRVIVSLGSATVLDRDLRVFRPDGEPSLLRTLSSRSLVVSAPLVTGGREIGFLNVVGDASDLIVLVAEALLRTALGAVAALAIGFLVAGRFGQGITRPIRQLTEAVGRIRREHDFAARVEATSNDEVGVLIDGFNGMLGEIGERDRRLEEHLRTLEDDIATATRELRAAKEAADGANAAKSDFLATMSHEIRTPMNGILVMAEMLAADELTPRQRRQAEIIARSGQSLVAIINDILDVSKIEAGRLDLEMRPVDLSEFASEVVALFGERAREKGIDLAAYVSPAVPRLVETDGIRLRQILGNLVNNAVKFTEAGHVLLTIEPDGSGPDGSGNDGSAAPSGALRFAVSDTGIGIPADKLEAVFAAFSQADGSTTRRFGGTGLGLTIARRLTEALGGDLRVTSTLGQGSVFGFSLRPRPLQAPSEWPSVGRRSGVAILSVAGGATKQMLSRLLTEAGYRPLAAPGPIGPGERAGAALVLADPDRVGPEAGRGGAPVICLAKMGDGAADALVAAGRADAALGWPVSRAELDGLLASLADGRRPAPAVAAAGKPAGGETRRFPGLHVLVADDSAVNREVAAEALRRLGASVEVVEDGLAAVAAASRGGFGLILMDGSMPELDGFEAARRIRAAEAAGGGARVPIVALTAHVVGQGAEAWRDSGMDGILHKPFTLRSLADRLAAVHAPGPASEAAPAVAATAGEAEPARPERRRGADRRGPPLLDPDMLDQLAAMASAGQGDFVERVFGLYLAHAPKGVAQLEAALARADLEAAGREAHALKSMSLNIGATRAAERAAALETAIRIDGRAPEGEERAALLDAVEQTVGFLQDRLRDGCDPEGGRRPGAGCVAGAADAPAGLVGEEAELAAELAAAVGNGEIGPAYQPIFDRGGTAMVAVEALARWTSPTRGSVPPGRFIPIAERTGLVREIGALMLRRACQDAAGWPGLAVAVNVSAIQLRDPAFPGLVDEVLASTGLSPGRLELEITETVLIEDESDAAAVMEALRGRGIRVALDDFGAGYSSLTYLRKFPFDKVKIDKSFIDGVTTSPEAATVVHAVISIGRALGMKIVAEGVETEEQRRFLAAAGVHMLQGYLLGEAVGAEAVTARLLASAPAAA